MYRLLLAITSMPQKEKSRVVRAIVQYTDALQHWKRGSELYALSHLYMGVEAVTPLVIRREINDDQRRCGPEQEPAAESRGAATPRFTLAPNGLSVLLFAGSLNIDATIGLQTGDQGFTGLRLALRLAIGLRNLEIGLAATLGADDTGGDALTDHVIAHCVSPLQRQPLVGFRFTDRVGVPCNHHRRDRDARGLEILYRFVDPAASGVGERRLAEGK
jgi:hypothetical protein